MLHYANLHRYARLRSRPQEISREDLAYLAFVRSHPCAAAGRRRGSRCFGLVEAHHVRRPGEKRIHRRTVPLCWGHHKDGSDAVHKIHQAAFERRFRVSFEREISRLNREWEKGHETKRGAA